MKIFLIDGMAFVEIGDKGYLLCIGTAKEACEATSQRLVELVAEAVAWSKFRAIETDNHVRH